jgi:hypothetical protein
VKARALRYSRFAAVEDFLRVGWMPLIPNAPHHHQYYGIELAWLCDCAVPGGFSIPETKNQEGEHERAASA